MAGISKEAGGRVLVICEKPDAAKRVSDALSGGKARASAVEGVTSFDFEFEGRAYVVCSAQGHVYSVSDPLQERTVYPVFDLEWYPSDLVDEQRGAAGKRIAAIRRLAAGASSFINACDFDAEGETIGFNVLRYACPGKEEGALRAKFSTLTREELVEAFRNAKMQPSQGLARAGRTRHVADFIWGVNLSRIISRAAAGASGRFRTVSIGRVQGPTLEFLVQRECQVRQFVPVPYWRIEGTFEKGGASFRAGYSKGQVESKAEADGVKLACEGNYGNVMRLKKEVSSVPAPPAFSIGDLQKEAYRAFGFTPSRTMRAAEMLYLSALISYPRTGSQVLPPSIGYGKILNGLGALSQYAAEVEELLRGDLRPFQGRKDDPAHPAIHPTGERPKPGLGVAEGSVYDLIARRFLAAFGASAKRETVGATVDVKGHEFSLSGSRTLVPGWSRLYGRYSGFRDAELPRLVEGDTWRAKAIGLSEDRQRRPPRYNQSTLLEEMEREKIGTKATRADIISTLVERAYVAGDNMEVTDLGFSVVETLRKHSPSVVTTGLTRGIEERLERIESGKEDEGPLIREAVRSIAESLVELDLDEESISRDIGNAMVEVARSATVLGPCPVCKVGTLRIVTSRKSKKRFVGCSNYPAGCRASAPLPQRGSIRTTPSPCKHCSWPEVVVSGGRRPWRLCVNTNCQGKKK